MTNFELATHIPLIIRAPWLSDSVGATTSAFVRSTGSSTATFAAAFRKMHIWHTPCGTQLAVTTHCSSNRPTRTIHSTAGMNLLQEDLTGTLPALRHTASTVSACPCVKNGPIPCSGGVLLLLPNRWGLTLARTYPSGASSGTLARCRFRFVHFVLY